MARFVSVKIGNFQDCYVNLDLVRAIHPIQAGGARLEFDENQYVVVDLNPDAVAGAIGQVRKQN
jgi:hypothetical protein